MGVGIHGDSLKIQRDFDIEMQGIVCLSEYANARLVAPPPAAAPAASAAGAAGPAAAAAGPAAAVQPTSGSVPYVACPQKWSLAGLVSLLLHLRLEKSQAVRCSNWEARPPLSGEQHAYAATDAWASLRVYEVSHFWGVAAPSERMECLSAELGMRMWLICGCMCTEPCAQVGLAQWHNPSFCHKACASAPAAGAVQAAGGVPAPTSCDSGCATQHSAGAQLGSGSGGRHALSSRLGPRLCPPAARTACKDGGVSGTGAGGAERADDSGAAADTGGQRAGREGVRRAGVLGKAGDKQLCFLWQRQTVRACEMCAAAPQPSVAWRSPSIYD